MESSKLVTPLELAVLMIAFFFIGWYSPDIFCYFVRCNF